MKMDWSKYITDSYERKARLYPALLTISPLIASATAVFADYLSLLESTGLLAFGSASAFCLAQIARDFGKEGEGTLWQSWGGMPSMAIFRHRNERLNPLTKSRCHEWLSQRLKTGAPTPDEERADPCAADTIYATWSDYLRTNTRDERFPLLLKENINYGHRRNVYGLRSVGIVASIVSEIICMMNLYFTYQQTGQINLLAGITGTYCFVLLILWLFYFTGDWVRITAESYADRLVESVETLSLTLEPKPAEMLANNRREGKATPTIQGLV